MMHFSNAVVLLQVGWPCNPAIYKSSKKPRRFSFTTPLALAPHQLSIF
jgi:hypothetical protein